LSAMTIVAILGGNAVADRALEALLRGAGYVTHLIEEPITGKAEELIRDAQLLLVAPSVGHGSRQNLLGGVGGAPGKPPVPVLTLAMIPETRSSDQTGLIAWPCRLEDLEREIDAVLSGAVPVEAPVRPD
jgi:hypothetical protein